MSKVEKFLKDYKLNLTAQQRAALEDIGTPTLMLAVPGSGKTTTMIARIGFMVYCCGIDASRILAISYTKASSADMSERFRSYFGDEFSEKVKFQTINALCQGIIYYYERLTGGEAFTLIDRNQDIVREAIVLAQNTFPNEYDIKKVQTAIAYIKNMMLDEGEIEKLKEPDYDIPAIYKCYERIMRSRRLMDFDDQLVYAYRMLRGYPEILQHYQDRYPYILVDEAQDTSKIQHQIIGLIASGYGNIFMVGDEDQSIYGFRAAYPEALLEFEETYKGSRVIYLEKNFRSLPDIVEKSNRFIKLNRARKDKNMTASREGSENNITLKTLNKRWDQYRELPKEAKKWKEETAILYRNNDSALPLISKFLKEGIAFRSRGLDSTFFTAPQVQLTLDIMDIARNPRDVELFSRIYYKFNAYISKEDMLRTIQLCDDDPEQNVFSALFTLFGNDSKKKKNLSSLNNNIAEIAHADAQSAIGKINALYNYHEDSERMFILSALAEYRESQLSFRTRLEELRKRVEEGSEDSDAKITLSTVHSAKGLEWEHVVIIDAIEGVFHQKMTSPDYDEKTKEEDRRLFYVAATRAKDRLTIYRYDDCKSPFVSSFVGAASKKKTMLEPDLSKVYTVGQRVKKAGKGEGTVIAFDERIVSVRFDSGEMAKYLRGYI